MATVGNKRGNIPPKVRQRKKHLISGPAGLWFQRQQEQSKPFSVTSAVHNNTNKNQKDNLNRHKIVDLCGDQPHHDADTTSASLFNKIKKVPKHTQNSLLLGDTDNTRLLRSDVAQTWDSMCLSLQRFVIPRHQHSFLLQHIPIPGKMPFDSSNGDDEVICASIMEMEYVSYHIVRKCVSEEYTLLYEVLHPSLLRPTYATLTLEQVRHWSTLPKEQSGLVIPQIILQIDHVYCHGHCDWTMELVDESVMDKNNFVSHSLGGSNKSSKGSILGWVEESFVKKNPAWIRPGVVLFCKNVSLAVFPSLEDEDTTGGGGDSLMDRSTSEGMMNENAAGNVFTRQTSGEMNFADDSKVDRMLLLGEDSIIYAWTPEEAAEEVSNDKFLYLMEMRAAMVSTLLDQSTDEHCANDSHTKRCQGLDVEKLQSLDRSRTESRPPNNLMERTNTQQLKTSYTPNNALKGPRSVASSIWIDQNDYKDQDLLTDTSPVSSVLKRIPSNSTIILPLPSNTQGLITSGKPSTDPDKVLVETRTTSLPLLKIRNFVNSAPESSISTSTRSYTNTTPLLSSAPSSYSRETPLLSDHGTNFSSNNHSLTIFVRTPSLSNSGEKIDLSVDSSASSFRHESFDGCKKEDTRTATPSPDQTILDPSTVRLHSSRQCFDIESCYRPDLGTQQHPMDDVINNDLPSQPNLQELYAKDSNPPSSLIPNSSEKEVMGLLSSDMLSIQEIPHGSSLGKQVKVMDGYLSRTNHARTPPNIWNGMTVDEMNALNRLLDDDVSIHSSAIIPQEQCLHYGRSDSNQNRPSSSNALEGLTGMTLDGFDEL